MIKGKVRNLSSDDLKKHSVDGISGATITSKGVATFLKRDLLRYQSFIIKMKPQ